MIDRDMYMQMTNILDDIFMKFKKKTWKTYN
jgi:hypothetical protein